MSFGHARNVTKPGSTTKLSPATKTCIRSVTHTPWKHGDRASSQAGYTALRSAELFGESMFHRVTDASKIALAGLVEQLKRQRFILLDTQWLTSHLLQFGAIEVSRAKYLELLERALNLERSFL